MDFLGEAKSGVMDRHEMLMMEHEGGPEHSLEHHHSSASSFLAEEQDPHHISLHNKFMSSFFGLPNENNFDHSSISIEDHSGISSHASSSSHLTSFLGGMGSLILNNQMGGSLTGSNLNNIAVAQQQQQAAAAQQPAVAHPHGHLDLHTVFHGAKTAFLLFGGMCSKMFGMGMIGYLAFQSMQSPRQTPSGGEWGNPAIAYQKPSAASKSVGPRAEIAKDVDEEEDENGNYVEALMGA